MKGKYLIIYSICFLCFINSGYGRNLGKTLPDTERKRFDYYFFEAQRQKDLSKHGEQLEALRMCLEIDSTNGAAQAEMGLLLARMNNLPDATKALKKAVESNPTNWWYRLQYISLLSGREQYNNAVEQAEILKKYYPQREDVYTILNSLYKQTGDYDKAIAAINQLEQFVGINEYLTYEKFQLYMILNKEKQAIHEFDKLIQKYPKENRYRVMLGDIYMTQNKASKALELYNSVLKDDPDNPYAYVSLADYYNSKGQSEKAVKAIVTSLKNPRLPSETKMDILGQYVDRLASNNKKNDETEDLFKMLIEMYPFEELPYAYYAIFLQNQDRDDEALKELETLISINPKNEAAWKTSLQIYTQKEDTIGILNLTERAIQELPEVPDFYFYRSIAQYQQGKLDDALQTNKLALNNLSKKVQKGVLSSFYGQIADIYFKKNDNNKAFDYYEKALDANPSNVYVMNNYAYYLSEEKRDLRKAERMSGKTVELEPNNSTYLDTYAWILYQQGNYTLARLYIDKAVSNLTDDTESEVIYEHSGDIYYALNETEKALEMWKKALSLKSDNDELRKKIDKAKSENYNN